LDDYNAEDVAVFSALDQLPVFLNITHSGVGRREVIFPYLVEASVVIRNSEPQIPALPVDTFALSPAESVGLMLLAVSRTLILKGVEEGEKVMTHGAYEVKMMYLNQ